MIADSAIAAWLDALHQRHVAPYRPPEFTKALRALSARYVERRNELAERSALDSAGKRSAFAAFYAPLHYFTVLEIVRALPERARLVSSITDLGCGTGVGAAAWAGAAASVPMLTGIDQNAWALEEAKWNWRALNLSGRAKRGDMAAELTSITRGDDRSVKGDPGLIFAWAVNEMPRAAQAAMLGTLRTFAETRGQILIIEPLAKGAAPWWPQWSKEFEAIGGQVDEWKFRVELPPMLKELSQRAGFNREYLGARSIWVRPV